MMNDYLHNYTVASKEPSIDGLQEELSQEMFLNSGLTHHANNPHAFT